MALGVVLTPYGHIPGSFPAAISTSYKGATEWQKPFDPFWYTRGEAGYYYDTQLGRGLGGMPTDFQLATREGYLPVRQGWVVTKQGYLPGGWQPPTGWYPNEPQAMRSTLVPRSGLGGLRDGAPATAEDLVAVMQAHNDRAFALTAITTVAVTVSALLGLFRTLKLIKEDR